MYVCTIARFFYRFFRMIITYNKKRRIYIYPPTSFHVMFVIPFRTVVQSDITGWLGEAREGHKKGTTGTTLVRCSR